MELREAIFLLKKYLDLACCSGANMLGHNTDISKKIFKILM